MKRKAFYLLSCALLTVGGVHAQEVDLQNLVFQKKYAAAVDRAAHLRQADSADFGTMYAAGQAYEGLLRYREAHRYYRHCLTLGDDAPIDLLNATARMAANIGMADEAEAYFLRALAIDSVDFYANYQLARLYFQSGSYARAADYYMLLIGSNPDNPVLLRGLGDCFSQMNAQPAAAMSYAQAFALNRENPGLASTLANTLLMLEQAPAALAVCDTALAYNPAHRLLLQRKGVALFTLKDYGRADSIYSQLMEQGDSSYMTVKYGGFSRYYAGKFLDAIVPLETAYALDTTATDVCMHLGYALGRTYDRKRAYGLFDRAEALMQPRPQLTDMLTQFRAETYARDGRTAEACALFYELWKKNRRTDMLSLLCTYSGGDLLTAQDGAQRERILFVYTLIATGYERSEQNGPTLSYVASQLRKFREDLFFRGLTEYPVLAPDGGRSVLTVARLQELIARLE